MSDDDQRQIDLIAQGVGWVCSVETPFSMKGRFMDELESHVALRTKEVFWVLFNLELSRVIVMSYPEHAREIKAAVQSFRTATKEINLV